MGGSSSIGGTGTGIGTSSGVQPAPGAPGTINPGANPGLVTPVNPNPITPTPITPGTIVPPSPGVQPMNPPILSGGVGGNNLGMGTNNLGVATNSLGIGSNQFALRTNNFRTNFLTPTGTNNNRILLQP